MSHCFPVLLGVILFIALVDPTSKAVTADSDAPKTDVSAVGAEAIVETGGPAIDAPPQTAVSPSAVEAQEDASSPTEFHSETDILRHCPLSDGFAYPVGAPDAKGYRDVQPFGRNHHLGEDWNGGQGKGGNGDLGDPIYSIADGIVTYAKPVGRRCRYGWGNVVKIVHNAGTLETPRYVESLYAHLDEIHVEKHQIVKRGDQVGTMGTCNGAYWSHLHFELREKPFMPIGRGYAVNKRGYLDPKKFIEQHRFNRSERTGTMLFAGRPTPNPR